MKSVTRVTLHSFHWEDAVSFFFLSVKKTANMAANATDSTSFPLPLIGTSPLPLPGCPGLYFGLKRWNIIILSFSFSLWILFQHWIPRARRQTKLLLYDKTCQGMSDPGPPRRPVYELQNRWPGSAAGHTPTPQTSRRVSADWQLNKAVGCQLASHFFCTYFIAADTHSPVTNIWMEKMQRKMTAAQPT